MPTTAQIERKAWQQLREHELGQCARRGGDTCRGTRHQRGVRRNGRFRIGNVVH